MKLDRAKALIDQGYAVFPCAPNGKKPMTLHGFKDAARSHFREARM